MVRRVLEDGRDALPREIHQADSGCARDAVLERYMSRSYLFPDHRYVVVWLGKTDGRTDGWTAIGPC